MQKWSPPFSDKNELHWLGRHLLFWLVYIVYFTYIMVPQVGDYTVSFKTSLLHLPFNLLLVYPMLYVIIPRLLRKDYRWFLILVITLLVFNLLANFAFRAFVLIPFRTGKPTPILNGNLNTSYLTIFTVGGFINSQSIVWTAAGLKLLRGWYKSEQTTRQLTTATLSVELQTLKAQIHPHFLFNTLNNLYSLTLLQSKQAPEMILKLTGLLHYMLNECNRPTIPLVKEIEFLTDYIELEKLRYGKRLMVTVTCTGDFNLLQIAPLLIIPLLENAFKHGSSRIAEHTSIALDLLVQEHTFFFLLKNNINQSEGSEEPILPRQTVNISKGIGLANVSRRLQLLYPGKHTFMTTQKDDNFIVNLTIYLPVAGFQ